MKTPQEQVEALTEEQAQDFCMGILLCRRDETLIVGLIIEKLQEWGVGIQRLSYLKEWWIYGYDFDTSRSPSLPKAFLLTAYKLGKWSLPEPEKPNVEYWRHKEIGRVERVIDDGLMGHWELVDVTPKKTSEGEY